MQEFATATAIHLAISLLKIMSILQPVDGKRSKIDRLPGVPGMRYAR